MNKRDPAFGQKVAELLAEGWTQKDKFQERLNKANLRKQIQFQLAEASVPNISRITKKANVNRIFANVEPLLNAKYEKNKNQYVPFYRLYNGNTKKGKSKSTRKNKKNNNVVMIENTAVFATPQNEVTMRAYIEANPHLMTNKERALYEKKKHAIAMNELVVLYDKMQAKEGNQDIGLSAAATPFARTPVAVSRALAPSSIVGSLASMQPTKESNLNYSRSKKRLINTRNASYRSIKMKSLGYALPATANTGSSAAAAAAAAVPLPLNNNNNNSNRNNNNSNSNNNTRSKRQKHNNFRFRPMN